MPEMNSGEGSGVKRGFTFHYMPFCTLKFLHCLLPLERIIVPVLLLIDDLNKFQVPLQFGQ
jgi:hypothetical protein